MFITARCGSSCTTSNSASKKSVVAGERDRPEVARRRAQWIKRQKNIDPERLVFIDETWTRTDMAPLRGWAPSGQRLIAKVPHGRWKTLTFLAALRHDRIEAPWLLEGPIDGESFRLYVEKVLLPTLRPGDIVIKLTPLLRKAAARTGEAICLALGDILQAFTPDECANYFANSGYRRT